MTANEWGVLAHKTTSGSARKNAQGMHCTD
jgi:hypothetical protein